MKLLFFLKRLIFRAYLALPFNRLLFSYIKSRYTPPYRIRRLLRFKGTFSLSLGTEAEIRLMSYGNTIENELFWLGLKGWEYRALQGWMRLSKSSQVILDVGANSGLYSVASRCINSTADIYAFEPLPVMVKRLQKNMALNFIQVHICDIALADENGEGKIYAAPTVSDTFDQASLNSRKSHESEYLLIRKKKMSTFIDEYKVEKVDLVKIDVETYEPWVLKGMEGYLEKFRPSFLIEILNEHVGTSVYEIVKGLGYKFYRIDEKKGYFPQDNLVPDRRGSNFFLINEKKHPDFHDSIMALT